MEAPTGINPKDVIDGLGKGLRVVEAFDDDHPYLTPSEVAERAGMTRTAARRYLLSLVHFGYAEWDGKRFWLLPRVLRLGQSYLAAARLPRLLQPFIQRVSMQTGETVNYSVLDGHEIVYLARSNPPRFVSIGYQVGIRVPGHVVTPGVTILSTWSDANLDQWIGRHEFVKFTSHTITEPDKFKDHVLAARDLGYWFTERQLDSALIGVATAIKDRKGVCQGAIGMTLQSQVYTRAEIEKNLLPPLMQVANELRPLL